MARRSKKNNVFGLLLVIIALLVLGVGFAYISLSPQSDASVRRSTNLMDYWRSRQNKSRVPAQRFGALQATPAPTLSPDSSISTIEQELNQTVVDDGDVELQELDRLIQQL